MRPSNPKLKSSDGSSSGDRPDRRKQRRAGPPDEEQAPPTASTPAPIPLRVVVPFEDSLLDQDALKVVRRLTRHGYEAYFVGGGVRDLLLGCRPKDFDIATDARPEQVRALFRNSRVIGRRFRLAHVIFGDGKLIEVATFRRTPESLADDSEGNAPEELLIRSDNAFGEAHEDAKRRDLTINGLFYDVDRREVIDYVGGFVDVQARLVRTIGDPEVRFREDPVRMLRSIKFAARLDLGIDPEVYDAIVGCREEIIRSAKARLLEELLKVLRCGSTRKAFWLLWETGLLHVLVPELATHLDDDAARGDDAGHVWRMLAGIDQLTIARDRPLDDLTLLTVMLLDPMREAAEGEVDQVAAAMDFAEDFFRRFTVPRRLADGMSRTIAALPRVASGRPGRFARSDLFRIASEVASIDREACR